MLYPLLHTQHRRSLELERNLNLEVIGNELRHRAVWHALWIRPDLKPADKHGHEQLNFDLQSTAPSHKTLAAPIIQAGVGVL